MGELHLGIEAFGAILWETLLFEYCKAWQCDSAMLMSSWLYRDIKFERYIFGMKLNYNGLIYYY